MAIVCVNSPYCRARTPRLAAALTGAAHNRLRSGFWIFFEKTFGLWLPGRNAAWLQSGQKRHSWRGNRQRDGTEPILEKRPLLAQIAGIRTDVFVFFALSEFQASHGSIDRWVARAGSGPFGPRSAGRFSLRCRRFRLRAAPKRNQACCYTDFGIGWRRLRLGEMACGAGYGFIAPRSTHWKIGG